MPKLTLTDFVDVVVSSGTPDHYEHIQALLGRDVICDGVLTISFDGHFAFSM